MSGAFLYLGAPALESVGGSGLHQACRKSPFSVRSPPALPGPSHHPYRRRRASSSTDLLFRGLGKHPPGLSPLLNPTYLPTFQIPGTRSTKSLIIGLESLLGLLKVTLIYSVATYGTDPYFYSVWIVRSLFAELLALPHPKPSQSTLIFCTTTVKRCLA